MGTRSTAHKHNNPRFNSMQKLPRVATQRVLRFYHRCSSTIVETTSTADPTKKLPQELKKERKKTTLPDRSCAGCHHKKNASCITTQAWKFEKRSWLLPTAPASSPWWYTMYSCIVIEILLFYSRGYAITGVPSLSTEKHGTAGHGTSSSGTAEKVIHRAQKEKKRKKKTGIHDAQVCYARHPCSQGARAKEDQTK